MRAAEEVMKRAYDGAQTHSSNDWRSARKTSANAEIGAALTKLQDRSRDLARNSPYFARAVNVIVNNTVGAGILGKIKGRNKTQEKKLNELWKQVAETPQCDVEGRHNFYYLQALAMRTIVESGELVALKYITGAAPQVKLLESDFIVTDSDSQPWIQGVKLDVNGKPEAYRIYKQHPGDRATTSSDFVEIPASRVFHSFRQERPGQVRGTPWAYPIIETLKDFSEWQTATLVRAKLAACVGGVITTTSGSGLSASDLKERRENEMSLSPGTFRYLNEGEQFSLVSPPGVEGYGEFVREAMRATAAGLGISFEAMTGDYSQVNFSSGRMGHIEFRRNIDSWRWNLLIPQFCDPYFQAFLEWAKLKGIDTEGARMEWVPPAHIMIDPVKEISADKEAVRAGFKSRTQVILESGNDPVSVFEEIKAEREEAAEAGVTFDTDTPVVNNTSTNGENDSEEEDDQEPSDSSDESGV
jgi:lambda family phage portal protein